MLNVGIIGLGVGEQHLIGFKKLKAIKIFIFLISIKKNERSFKKYNGLILGNSAEDLIENTDIDIVSIASFDQFHRRQILNALKNNKHVFVKNQFVKILKNLI